MSRGKVMVALGAVVVLGAGGLGARAVMDEREQRSACADVRRIDQAWGDHTIEGDGTRVHVLGDSYAQGAFLDDPTRSWVSAFAEETGHTVTVDGIAGTGFTASGFCGADTFETRAEALADADVAVVQGGLNDVYSDVAEVEREAADLLGGNLPERVVVIGPPRVPGRDAADVEAVDAALARAADRAGATYVSTLDWPLDLLADQTHPTEGGHATFGRAVAQVVR